MILVNEDEFTEHPHVATAKLGSGWAAICYVDVVNGSGAFMYTDIWQTGVGRYATEDEAYSEALTWAEAEELPIVVDGVEIKLIKIKETKQ